jgi:pilus assembly protein CpaB
MTQPGPERANRLIFVGAVALAVIAAVLAFVALSNFGGSGGGSSTVGGDADVVIASSDLEAGTTITSDMLEIATVPGQVVIDGAISDAEQLVGLTITTDVLRGEQFAATKLVGGEVDEDAPLVFTIPDGHRAISIGVESDKIVGGHLPAGDRVDVIAVFEPEVAGGGSSVMVSRVLMQDIEVLAVAENTQVPITQFDEEGNVIVPEDADEAQGLRPTDEDPDPDADTVTLAVPTNDVALVPLAVEDGTVYLALRPIGATDAPSGATITGIPAN